MTKNSLVPWNTHNHTNSNTMGRVFIQYAQPLSQNASLLELADSSSFLGDNASSNTLRGHTNAISCIAVSGDEKRIFSGSWDKTIRVWDSEPGACLRVLGAHRLGPISYRFSGQLRETHCLGLLGQEHKSLGYRDWRTHAHSEGHSRCDQSVRFPSLRETALFPVPSKVNMALFEAGPIPGVDQNALSLTTPNPTSCHMTSDSGLFRKARFDLLPELATPLLQLDWSGQDNGDVGHRH